MSQILSSAPTRAAWHNLSSTDVLSRVESVETGLEAAEAARRLEVVGPNTIPSGPGEGLLQLLFRQINNPLIYVLLGSAVLAMAMGEAIDGAVVLAVVVLNTAVGFVQELRAGKAIEALADMVPQTATVVRGGERRSVAAAEIVPGDVLALDAGDKVPADARILAVRNLHVDEAALTGESVPVAKHVAAVPAEAGIGDRRNLAFGGTLVTRGTATAVVVATGGATELGRISSMLHEATELETPLTLSMSRMSRMLTFVILAVAAVIVGVALLRGYPPIDAMLAGISLAVAAIPEGLPAIITISLAIGVQRMARRRAVIRKLPAVETLGSTGVICSDKTGTLTRNEMTVQALWTPGPAKKDEAANAANHDGAGDESRAFEVTGVGYAPVGKLLRAGAAVPELPDDLRELLCAGLLCNDAGLTREGTVHGITGDPTEGALVVAAEKLGVSVEAARREHPRCDAVPFSSELQLMATMHVKAGGERVIFMKGAPEAVLQRCGPGEAQASRAMAEVERLAARGMRVLAVAARPLSGEGSALDEADLDEGFRLIGLQGMIDPPRAEAIEAIQACHHAGIIVKMITGDHLTTARAIGEQLGLIRAGGEARSGADIERLSDAELRGVAASTNVFARVAPEHKLRLVKALQAEGQVVAMTGDGVNDAPALKQANIGVAMGITGTEVSKESADVVLTDDNFASIRAAVEEGRRVYDNLVKALAFVLPTNLGEALILLVAVLAFPIVDGQPLMPITAVQILWVNLVATVALSLPLAFEAMEKDVMSRPPRRPEEPIMSRFVLVRTVLVAVLMTAGAVGLFLYEYFSEVQGGVISDLAYREAQTTALTTVVLFQIFYVLDCRTLRDSMFAVGVFSNPWVYAGIAALLVLQIGFVYIPFMHRLFGSAALSLDAWIKSTGVALSILPVMGLERWWRKRLAARRREKEQREVASTRHLAGRSKAPLTSGGTA